MLKLKEYRYLYQSDLELLYATRGGGYLQALYRIKNH